MDGMAAMKEIIHRGIQNALSHAFRCGSESASQSHAKHPCAQLQRTIPMLEASQTGLRLGTL